MSELISVIVPIFNKDSYLPSLLTSIKNQSYKNFECIMIDDGSTDNSSSIADYFATVDERFKVFHTENNGSSVARNIALTLCSGDFISFVDADDAVDVNFISTLYDALKISNSDISVCNFFVDDVLTPIDQPSIFIDDEIISAYIGNSLKKHKIANYIFNKLYSRDVIGTIKFPQPITISDNLIIRRDAMEDAIFTSRVLLNAHKLIQISSPLYYYKMQKQKPGDNLSLIGKPPPFIFGYLLNLFQRYKILIDHILIQNDLQIIFTQFMNEAIKIIFSNWMEVSNIFLLIRQTVVDNYSKLSVALQDEKSKIFFSLLLNNVDFSSLRQKLSCYSFFSTY